MHALDQLKIAVAQLPPEHLVKISPYLSEVSRDFELRRNLMAKVQESIQQLQVDIKYMAFDLECTRRERDEALGH